MMKKKYIKPEIEELLDTRLNLLLTTSQTSEGTQTTPEGKEWNARQQDMSNFDFDEEEE